MQRRDLVARILGLLVFALGIVILIFSFFSAYSLFTATEEGIAVTPADPEAPPVTANLGSTALVTLIRLAALFIMVLVGSLIASRGVQMYFAGEKTTQVQE